MPQPSAARRAVAALATVALAAAAALGLGLRASLPRRAGTIATPGLAAPVSIRFDAERRPYVQAESLADALFAEGFLHASERLFQMELLRRAGSGRLAELLGPDLLETDRALWRAGVPGLAARLHANASAALLELVGRYAAGVDAGAHALGARPPELLLVAHAPRTWSVPDVFAVGAIVAFDSAANMENEVLRLALASTVDAERFALFLPEGEEPPHLARQISQVGAEALLDGLAPLDAAARAGLASAALGSNGWALAPWRSASGRALLAFDSHDALALPNLFYEVHLFFGGSSIRGGSIAGLPGVVNGFNDRIAWGLTNVGDTQDLFLETRDPAHPRRFRASDGWYDARTEEVRIPVRGRAEPERLEVVVTRNGPLVRDDPPIALRWTGHAADASGLEGLLATNQARDWPGFRAAIDRHFAPSANVTYADVDGRVALRTIGRLPVRARGAGLFPRPGDEVPEPWPGTIAAGDLPARVDPPEGFVAVANARVSPPGSGPLVSADNAPDYRVRRIAGVLGGTRTASVDDMRALQMDWWNPQAALLLPAMLPALAGLAPGGDAGAARAGLEAWARDPRNEPTLAAPLVFERWYLAVARRVFEEPLGADLYGELLQRGYVLNHALDRLLLSEPGSPWWGGRRDETLSAGFADAVAGLASELGPDPRAWRFGERHRVWLRHELGSALPLLGRWLDRGPHAWGGGAATVGRASARYDRPEVVSHAATLRLVAEMSQPVRAFAVIPGGQSGHPASPHYDDQTDDWLAGRLQPLAARPEEVAGDLLELVPADPGPR